jgi:hypothetical protein
MVPVSTVDNGKAAWDTCGTDHGSLLLVCVPKHFMVGTKNGWYPHVYGMTMVLSSSWLVPTMGGIHMSMA